MKNTILTLALVSAIAGLSNATFAGEDCGKCSKKKCNKEAAAPKEGEQAPAAPAEGQPAPAPEAPKAP